VDIIGELADECVFVAVKKGGKVSDEGDLKAGVKIAVGEPSSGSYASWQYLQGLEKDYAKVETYAKGGVRSLAKITTGEYDAFLGHLRRTGRISFWRRLIRKAAA
jgi:hypothetical protein